MSIRFRNAPLVELIVELRWDATPTTVQATTGPINVSFGTFAAPDDFFQRVAQLADEAGYRNSEHLLPPGFPAGPGQVARRFRASPGDPILMQVGLDLFSVNALPPYNSWDQFSAKVRQAVEVLVAARQSDQPFTSVTIRYLDAFDSRFTQGKAPAEFITETLGFTPTAPGAISRRAEEGTVKSLSFQYGFSTDGDLDVQLSVADGQIGATRAVIYDSVVGRSGTIAADADAVMEVLDAAHLVAHEMFVDMAKKLFPIMEPMEGPK